jgi:DNA-binding transcriptional regulator GbsR (MarR family)
MTLKNQNVFEVIFGKAAQNQVLYYMLVTTTKTIYLSGIARDTGLSHSSVSRVMETLKQLNIVEEEAIGTQIRVFRLTNSILVKKLQEFTDCIENTV